MSSITGLITLLLLLRVEDTRDKSYLKKYDQIKNSSRPSYKLGFTPIKVFPSLHKAVFIYLYQFAFYYIWIKQTD